MRREELQTTGGRKDGMDEKGYREVVVVDPGAEPLHPIFTRTVGELVAER